MITGTFPNVADPAWLLLLALLPLLAWLHHRRRSLGALTCSMLPVGSRRRAWRLHLPFYARLLALGCLVCALARPQLGYAWEESLTEGIDIQIVLDNSGSMGAQDFQPKDRLTVAKQVVRDFVAGRTGDRLGLTVFAGTAMTRAPLTSDRDMLGILIDGIEVTQTQDGTAIGVALASAAARLKNAQARSRVIVLVTDGANNAGETDPGTAAAICAGLGLKVYTIGVGNDKGIPVRVPRYSTDLFGRTVVQSQLARVEMDTALLRGIADRTGGRYFLATDRESLRRVFAQIDRLEKTPLQVKRYVRYRELFPPLAWAGLGLLLLPLAMAGARVTAEP